jgi:Adenine-specific methyltransferase EcoRI
LYHGHGFCRAANRAIFSRKTKNAAKPRQVLPSFPFRQQSDKRVEFHVDIRFPFSYPCTMAKKVKNQSLAKAREAKQDEFYTQLSDIESELKHYRDHFKGKVIYCNCDDPRVSNFFHYFSYNFEKLGLKKLIATCYKSQERDLFSHNDSEHAIYLEYKGTRGRGNVPDPETIGIKHLKGDGDFRSAESIDLLKQADIVVTNPPFSLFREYVMQLMEYDKKFLIVANQNAATYKEIFHLIQENKLWLGYRCGDMAFKVPDYYEPRETRYWQDETGQKWRSLGNACWFTNLDIAKRHEELILYQTYSPDAYPKYDNFDAIEVGRTENIPIDYAGTMGLPVTFLDKHNPDQFEIVGITKTWYGSATKTYPTQVQVSANGQRSNVMKLNDGAVLRVNAPPKGKTYYTVGNKFYMQFYPRILIRRKASQ